MYQLFFLPQKEGDKEREKREATRVVSRDMTKRSILSLYS